MEGSEEEREVLIALSAAIDSIRNTENIQRQQQQQQQQQQPRQEIKIDLDEESGFDFSIDSLDYDWRKFVRSLAGPLVIVFIWMSVVTTVMLIDGTKELWIYLSILIFFVLVLVMAASCNLCCGHKQFGCITSEEWFVRRSAPATVVTAVTAI